MADNLVVTGIEFDSRMMVRAIEQAERRLERLEDQVDSAGRSAKKSEKDFLKMAAGVAVAFGAFTAAKRAAGFIFETNKEFQQLEARLTSITGSARAAETAFNLITDFAVETPFEVANLTEAFTLLQAVGIEPTKDMLRDLGNFAAAFGADILEFSNAVVRAGAGETEALKRFGIVARAEGQSLQVTFRGITHTVDKEFGAVVDLFRKISAENFPGAMAMQMDTLVGSISNLKDAAALAAKEVGEQGMNAAINDLAKELTAAIQLNDEFARQLGGSIANGVKVSGEALMMFLDHLEAIVFAMQVLTGAAIGAGLGRLVKGITSATGAMVGLNAAIASNPVGFVLTLAGAIGGPLLINLLAAKDEAKSLADEIARLNMDDGSAEAANAQLAGLKSRRALLSGNMPNLRDSIQTAKDAGSDTLAASLGRTASANLRTIAELDRQIAEIEAKLLGLQTLDPIGNAGASTGGGTPDDTFEKLNQQLEEQLIKLRDGERAAFEYALSLEKLDEGERKHLLTLYDAAQAQDAENTAKKEAAAESERNAESVAQILQRLEEQNILLTQGEDALLRYTLASKDASEADIQRAIAQSRANREREEANRKADEEREKLEREATARMEAQAQQLQDAADRMAGHVSEAFSEWVTGAEKAEEAFRGLIDGVIAETMRLVTQRTITEPLAQFIVGLIGGAAGGAAGGGQAVGDAVFGGFAAGGGSVSANTSYIVGEKGPELFTPGSNGFITPNHAMGGQVVNQVINFNVSAIDGRDMRRALEEQRGVIAEVVGQAAQDSTGYRRLLGGG